MTRALWTLLFAGALVAQSRSLAAQAEPPVKVPALSEIEPLDRRLKLDLDKRYSVLLRQSKATNESIAKWNDDYGDKTLKEADAQVALAKKKDISDELLKYSEEVGVFNADVSRLHLFPETAPAGLDPAMKKAIAAAYKNSPRGVIDNIENGFEAVDRKNWLVARISFKNALKRDPDNVGIQRLVALCDYSLTLSVPPEDLERGANDFYLDYVPKHPELKLKVKTIPAAPVEKPEAMIDIFIKAFETLVRPPAKKTGHTLVVAKRG